MATPGKLLSDSFSGRIYSFPDRFFNEVSLPTAAATITSSKFQWVNTQSQIGLELKLDSEVTVADTKTLTVELFGSATEGGSFTLQKTLKSYAPSGGTDVIPAGVWLLEVPEDNLPIWGEIRITASEDQSAHKVTGNIIMVKNSAG